MRIVKYFFVGGAATAVDFGIFALFASYLGYPWFIVSICSMIAGTLTNYFLSIRYVFRSGSRHSKHLEVAGVFIVSGLGILANQFILYIAIEWLKLGLMLSKCIATGIVFFWNYLGRSKLVFSK
jgi:putative flippase GtrA